MIHMLLVEDDEIIRESVAMALERYGYQVTATADGLAALETFVPGTHEVLLLDVMLPGLDGISLCRRVRESSQVPVLMMSARGESLDVVAGLEAGADDYVVKPVDTSVLVARIRALLRRATAVDGAASEPAEAAAADGPLAFGDVLIDTLGLEVTRAGRRVELTPTELRLLLEFAAHAGAVLDRQQLLRRVWDYGWDGDSRIVDMCVRRLRGKIGTDRIETVRGFGYKLRR
ncbi:two-component system response regulator CseB (plasmid) [Streptomyces sp. HUAS TT11]|uniref:two-component system response regulator CseB n=1 Tax=Streptomyces sp. HUAS TT11 TaxID=3447508 RepID=UPI003F659DB2